eukprot:3570398-Pyramimonas_sp.AAC.1
MKPHMRSTVKGTPTCSRYCSVQRFMSISGTCRSKRAVHTTHDVNTRVGLDTGGLGTSDDGPPPLFRGVECILAVSATGGSAKQ